MTHTHSRFISRSGVVLGLVLIALTGCGFHVRGPQPMAFSSIHVGGDQYSRLGVNLRRQIALSGTTKVEEDPKRAEVQLQILSNDREREILSLTPAGKVREYELTHTFRFRLISQQNKELIAPSNIVARREYTFNDEQVLGKEQEETLLFREMEDDILRQIIWQLSAWKPGSRVGSGRTVEPLPRIREQSPGFISP